jgi:hypothetical protein
MVRLPGLSAAIVEHVKILRAMAGRPQVEIGIADAADHGFLVLQLGEQL